MKLTDILRTCNHVFDVEIPERVESTEDKENFEAFRKYLLTVCNEDKITLSDPSYSANNLSIEHVSDRQYNGKSYLWSLVLDASDNVVQQAFTQGAVGKSHGLNVE